MRLLIVGEIKGHLTAASKIALDKGADVVNVTTISQALEHLRNGKGADLVMIDVSLSVFDMVNSLKSERINIEVVACGITTKSEDAVAAIKAGAKEYIPLPPDPDLIAAVIEAVSNDSEDFISRDPVMKRLFKVIDQIAPSEASVLITGESGTGKEVMARYIHNHSSRKSKLFVSVNCAAIPENLLESELFGHEKGSFTGAMNRRIGKFEEANDGTLLLDEITEMPPQMQAKLLRAIQEREIDRVGGSKPIKINIRLIATSNRNIEEAVKAGIFREDLYFRLNVVSVEIPPLRERPMDIDILADHFNEKYSLLNAQPIRTISNSARNNLRGYNWKGNVRELENTMHRAVLFSSGNEIGPDAVVLPQNHDVGKNSHTISNGLIGRSMADVEKDLIIGTLSHCLGNRTHAAKVLGISIRTLRNKLGQYKSLEQVG